MTDMISRAQGDALTGDVFDQKTVHRLQLQESDSLFAWVLQQFETKIDGAHCYRMTLNHRSVNDGLTALGDWTIAGHTDAIARATVAALRVQANGDATTRSGHHEVYVVQAFWPSTDVREHPFEIDGAKRREQSTKAASSEPASLEGALRMQFRHNELLMKLVVGSQEQNQKYTSDLIQQLSARVKVLDEGRLRVLEVSEQLLNAQAERQAEQARTAAAEQRKAQMFQVFTDMMPVLQGKIIEKVTGAKMAGENPFMKSFIGALSQADIDKMIKSLDGDPSKQLLLIEAVVAMQKDAAAHAPKQISGTAQIAMPPKDEPPSGGSTETH